MPNAGGRWLDGRGAILTPLAWSLRGRRSLSPRGQHSARSSSVSAGGNPAHLPWLTWKHVLREPRPAAPACPLGARPSCSPAVPVWAFGSFSRTHGFGVMSAACAVWFGVPSVRYMVSRSRGCSVFVELLHESYDAVSGTEHTRALGKDAQQRRSGQGPTGAGGRAQRVQHRRPARVLSSCSPCSRESRRPATTGQLFWFEKGFGLVGFFTGRLRGDLSKGSVRQQEACGVSVSSP